MTKINLNKYAMEQRIAGKLLREIGEEMGVGVERARQRVAWGFRHAEKYERDKNATTMGDLFISERLKNVIKGIPANKDQWISIDLKGHVDIHDNKPNGIVKETIAGAAFIVFVLALLVVMLAW